MPDISNNEDFAPGDARSSFTASIQSSGPASNTGNEVGMSSLGSGGSSGGSGGNVLHNYVNYAYRLELWAVPKNQVSGGELLIADSGTGSQHGADFSRDMSIDNLEMSSVVGLTHRGRNTDVVTFKFDIIEPYSANLFAQLKSTCDRINPGAQWNSGFFLLKIKWLGYTDDGLPTGVITTKVVPFTFVHIKMSINSGGATYNCRAIPSSHYALGNTENMIPFHMELQGKTVDQLLHGPSTTSGIKALETTLNEGEKELIRINNSQIASIPNEYVITIDPGIGNSKLYDDAHIKEQNLSLPDAQQAGNWLKSQKGELPLDMQKNIFRAAPGTKITDFINQVISTSDYVKNQLNGGKLQMWKVVTSTQPKAWDPQRNDWARKFTYKVIPFEMKGISPPHVSTSAISQGDCVRNYQYIFTGQNKDILRLDLDFNMAFWTALNANAKNYLQDSAAIPQTVTGADPSADSQAGKGPLGVERKRIPVRGLASRQNTGGNTESQAKIAVQNIMEHVFDNGVDLITVDLEIVGDPDWISGHDTNISDTIDINKEQYIYIQFKTPTDDYQDDGLFQTGQSSSTFTGAYKVISVKTTFSKGIFKQILKCIRLPNQR